MFKLYRFENMLYTMSLSGEEIRKYLEYSYDGWINTMKNAEDYLFRYRLDADGKPVLNNGRAYFRNQSYNFDSAAGIDYIVDVSKPAGERIKILAFTDGKPFEPDKKYTVAVNSYRGNGGGNLLTEGAGLSPEEARKRLLRSTDKDLRYYMMKYIEEQKTISPEKLNNWKFIPEDWVMRARPKEYKLLFGEPVGN
jgi:2',3'-cyclic-nucleotide 2'-phosphodiesterase/3'-nucleotidase